MNNRRDRHYSSSDDEKFKSTSGSRGQSWSSGGKNSEEGLNSVIQVMNQLYDVGHRINTAGKIQGSVAKIQLPEIVVCGSQSSGKTSVLESISGEQFLPRGVDIQTRCPIVMQLIHTTDNAKWVEFPHQEGKKFNNMADVKTEIDRINSKIIDSKQTISDEPITLKLYSPNVPNLTLCDLPGLVENPTEEQPPDLVEKINKMVLDYIKNENCIILAISSATQDIADSKSIRLAREVDPKGQRTLGVLTKLDLMDRGTNANDVLLGKRIKLGLGIVGVVNRSYMDVQQGKSLQDQLIKEKRFLEQAYPSLASTNGTPFLVKRISRLLLKTIERTLPGIKSTMEQLIEDQKGIIEDLGEPEKVETNKNALLLSVLSKFSEAYCAQMDGRRRNLELGSLNASARIKQLFDQKLGAEFEKLVAANMITDEEIDTAIHNSHALHSRRVDYDDAFQELAKREIKRLAPYVTTCAREVCREMRHAVDTSCDSVLKDRYPKLYEEIKRVALELINERFEDCRHYLDDYLNAEASIARTIKGSFREKNGGYEAAPADETGNQNTEEYTYVVTEDQGGKPSGKKKMQSVGNNTNGDTLYSDNIHLEDGDIHRSNVRKDVQRYFHGTKMQIMEHVARGIIYKLVYGTSDRITEFMLLRLNGTEDVDTLLVNPNEDLLNERRQASVQTLKDYEEANKVIDMVLAKVA